MRIIHKKNLLKIGNARGVYLPIDMVRNLDLHNGYVKLYKQDDKLYIEKLIDCIDLIEDVYIKTLKTSGGSYRIMLPKKIIRELKSNKFDVFKQNNKIVIRNMS